MSHARGRGVAAALSRKAFTNGSSGMKSPAAPQRLSRDANAFAGTLAANQTQVVRMAGRHAHPLRAVRQVRRVRLAAKPAERQAPTGAQAGSEGVIVISGWL